MYAWSAITHNIIIWVSYGYRPINNALSIILSCDKILKAQIGQNFLIGWLLSLLTVNILALYSQRKQTFLTPPLVSPRNFILMSCRYQNMGVDSNWSKKAEYLVEKAEYFECTANNNFQRSAPAHES